jgi:hypothetical protein
MLLVIFFLAPAGPYAATTDSLHRQERVYDEYDAKTEVGQRGPVGDHRG